MKNFIYLFAAAFTFFNYDAQAQTSNAIFFTENGERFQVVLNGILQNANYETNVKLTGLNAPNYKTRILFEDKSLGYVDYNLIFPNPAIEVTFNIKKNNKGVYVVRYVSEVDIASAPPPPATQTVVVYSTTPPPASATVHQTTTTTTTTTSGDPNAVNINMGVNVGGTGGSINMNMSGMDGSMQSHSTTTTTTTVSGGGAPTPPPAVIYVQGYNGPVGCPVPMNNSEFQSFKSSVSSKSFEDSKLTIAKQVLNNNCLTSAQVKEVLGLFSFEDTKLTFAKYAYGYTYDIKNYYKVNDAFTFESSIEELNNYINSRQ